MRHAGLLFSDGLNVSDWLEEPQFTNPDVAPQWPWLAVPSSVTASVTISPPPAAAKPALAGIVITSDKRVIGGQAAIITTNVNDKATSAATFMPPPSARLP